MMKNAVPEMDGRSEMMAVEKSVAMDRRSKLSSGREVVKEPAKAPDMPVRRNFNETAFFFPALMTDENGDVILKFTVPESLTAWKLMALAYTKDLKTGQLEKEVVSTERAHGDDQCAAVFPGRRPDVFHSQTGQPFGTKSAGTGHGRIFRCLYHATHR